MSASIQFFKHFNRILSGKAVIIFDNSARRVAFLGIAKQGGAIHLSDDRGVNHLSGGGKTCIGGDKFAVVAAAEQDADNGAYFYEDYKRSTTNFSLGCGVRFASGSSLDFAWTSSTARYTNSVLYDYYGEYAGGFTEQVNSPIITDSKQRKSVFTMSYSVLF